MKGTGRLETGRLILLVTAVLFLSEVNAQPTSPNPAPGSVNASAQGALQQPMMVTNAEYKKFDPTLTFQPDQGEAPVALSARQAVDYVIWTGKKMGSDYGWKRMPPGQQGYLYMLTGGVSFDGVDVTPMPPTPPEGMVYVPQGPFIMGSEAGDADETPKHTAYAGPFFCDKYEVSNEEYRKEFPNFEFPQGRENFPAIVTWEQAAKYAERVHKRLPSEAEWEKAARGTDGRTFPWGESYDPTFVSWDETYPRGGAPARPESPYGCFDMAGGAWEWTADWYKPYPGNDTPCDEYGETYKVIRGGASFNDIAMMRTSHRYYLPPNTTGHVHVGFRCVKDIE